MTALIVSSELKYITTLIAEAPSGRILDELHDALESSAGAKEPGLRLMRDYLRRRAENPQEPSLDSEWMHLFGGIPVRGRMYLPYEGCWTIDGGSAFGQSHLFLELKKAYRKGGFSISEKSVRPDELRVQLEFVSRLLAEGKVDQARAFCCDHLAVWLPRYADEVDGLSESGFYKGVFEYLRWVLKRIDEEGMHE